MEQINRIGDETVITNNGKPKFSRLLPYRKPVSSLFGLHSGRLGSRGRSDRARWGLGSRIVTLLLVWLDDG
jgi:hypothetical protein